MTCPPPSEPAGLYLHLPFCAGKCLYCNFRIFRFGPLAEPYLEALHHEAEAVANRELLSWPEFDTVYCGGGTPSLFPPEALGHLLDRCRALFRFRQPVETSLEANPPDVTADQARAWRSLGVNRVTIGVQTIHQPTLDRLRRPGSFEAVRRAVEALRSAGMDNIGLDLIAGLPGEGLVEWRASLHNTLALAPDHVSLYLLEVDEDTPLYRQIRSGRLVLAPDDDLARFYLEAIARLEDSGLCQYEISNFARSGRESRHNRKYWDLVPYLGLGCGAHSFDGRVRRWNDPRLGAYLAAVRLRGEATAGREPDHPAERAREYAMLALRQTRGLSRLAFRQRFASDLPAAWERALKKFVVRRWVLTDNDRLRLTPRGMLFSNEILQELFDED